MASCRNSRSSLRTVDARRSQSVASRHNSRSTPGTVDARHSQSRNDEDGQHHQKAMLEHLFMLHGEEYATEISPGTKVSVFSSTAKKWLDAEVVESTIQPDGSTGWYGTVQVEYTFQHRFSVKDPWEQMQFRKILSVCSDDVQPSAIPVDYDSEVEVDPGRAVAPLVVYVGIGCALGVACWLAARNRRKARYQSARLSSGDSD